MEECENFIEVLTQVLEQPDNIDASIYCATPEEFDEYCDDPYVNINIWNKNTENICAYVKYIASDKAIHIEEISRCSGDILPEQGSGTDIVKKLIEVGEEFRKQLDPGTQLVMIIDSDQSKLKIKGKEFALSWLYIFATGETWYNSLGFREENYEDNTKILTDFIDKKNGKTTIREQFQKIKRDLRDPDIAPKIIDKYKETLNKTVQKFNKYYADGVANGTINEGEFRTKFSNISYDYLTTGVGLGLGLKKKKRKTRKHKRKVVRQGRSKVRNR